MRSYLHFEVIGGGDTLPLTQRPILIRCKELHLDVAIRDIVAWCTCCLADTNRIHGIGDDHPFDFHSNTMRNILDDRRSREIPDRFLSGSYKALWKWYVNSRISMDRVISIRRLTWLDNAVIRWCFPSPESRLLHIGHDRCNRWYGSHFNEYNSILIENYPSNHS
jgi:hypothetical protein